MKEAWAQDRAGACQKAGLDPDTVALDENGDMSLVFMSLSMKQVGPCNSSQTHSIVTCVAACVACGLVWSSILHVHVTVRSSVSLSSFSLSLSVFFLPRCLFSGLSSYLLQCEICFCDFTPDQMVQIPCSHHFCVECWKRYLT